ncbi:MAG TPA: sigma-70 family RNA polymerase sigma factor [Planctomycetes bacterium]|nr:sigma-70 family RNA polymerase sigma factor [Planctomycetota bacterium]HIL36086.1 sigma-70 family RNA polymerase sigma factor [Planctomycetota bacterium]
MAHANRLNLRPRLGAAPGESAGKGRIRKAVSADELLSARGYNGSAPPMQEPQNQPQPPQDSSRSGQDEADAIQRTEERARDHALVRQAQDGEEDAFRQLVERHEARAQRVARKMVPSEEDARDLCQEAFLRVFRHLKRFDFQYAFSTWLYRIVTNLAIDNLRKRRPTSSLVGSGEDEPSIDLPDDAVEDPSDQMTTEETRLEVHSVLQTLAPHFQSVMALREIEGLGCPEIAEIVGATHVTVRWRLHRARKLFLEEWQRRERVQASGNEAKSTNDPSARP